MTSTWILCATVAVVLHAISNFIDKTLMEREGLSAIGLVLLTGLIALPAALVLLPYAHDIGIGWYLCFFSGLLSIWYVYPYARALQREDASTVVPLFGFSPLITLVVATVVLQEQLSQWQLIGGLFIIGGGFLLGAGWDVRGSLKIRPALFWMLASSTLYATLGFLIQGAHLTHETIWAGLVAQNFGAAVAALLLAVVKPHEVHPLLEIGKRRWGLYLTCAVIGLFALWAETYAISLVGAAKVRLITALQPLVVFFMGLGFTVYLPSFIKESMERGILVQRFVSVVIIALGCGMLA